MGIGGGLAIVVGLAGPLHVGQHRAQAANLAVSTLPLTAPAAITYLYQGWSIPWSLMLCIVIGLIGGNDVGARLAVTVRPIPCDCVSAWW
jgi:uncharacterized membrane protein YfcA